MSPVEDTLTTRFTERSLNQTRTKYQVNLPKKKDITFDTWKNETSNHIGQL